MDKTPKALDEQLKMAPSFQNTLTDTKKLPTLEQGDILNLGKENKQKEKVVETEKINASFS